jgi:hypothetical protein
MRHYNSPLRFIGLSCALVLACGGGSSSPTGSTNQQQQTSALAGTYQTAVSLTSNTCTGISVQNNPTTVVHAPGATTFTMSHAGQTYTGALGTNNAFTTQPKPIEAGSVTHTLTIAGQFTTNGFTADVTVNVTGTGNGAPCQYVVRWVGTK